MTTTCPPPTRRTVLTGAAASGLWTLASPGRAFAATSRESSGVFLDDASLFERAYTALHPGLYRYNTISEMAGRFDWLRRHFSVPRTQREAYLALARVTAAVRCGHSYPNFYNQTKSLRTAMFEDRDRLPFHFRWIGERMIVTHDLSPGAPLAAGSEILSIEGYPARSILRTLMPLARADGHNDAKRLRILEVSGIDRWEAFDIYLPMALPSVVARGRVGIVALDPAGKRHDHDVDLMTADQRADLAPSPIDLPGDAILWRVERKPGGVAILSMPTWGVYNGSWDWEAWLNARLEEIAGDGTRTLIVDLRGNEGGLDCGNPILARLVDRDLVTIGNGRRVRYRKVPDDLAPHVDTWDDSFRDWGAAAVGPRPDGFYDLTRWSDDGSGQIIIKPSGKAFKGKLIVLIDAVNSSATFQFAQIVKDNALGTLIGETTGGNRRGINGGAFLFLRLPASGIEVDIPLIGYFPPAPQPDAGIMPDVRAIETAQDIAKRRDVAMTSALIRAA